MCHSSAKICDGNGVKIIVEHELPEDDKEINSKEKIKYCYENPKVVEKMGKASRKRVESYSWDHYGNMVAEKYKEVLKKSHGVR